MSADASFTLQHGTDGELVLRDRARAGEIWRVGPPSAGPGQLSLVPEGYLVLADAGGRPYWRSGDVDRRVVAAVVTDDGRLALLDPDGFQRWSRDPLTDEDLAGYRPASGDRLTRGQRLTGPLVSPNGAYILSPDPAAGILLVRRRGGQVWSRPANAPLSLGPDGILRTGTDSTVLTRWIGRRLDHTAYSISALVVADDGDIVLLGEDGSEVYRSGSAAEEARLDRLEKEYERREREDAAKPLRPLGTALPADWFCLFKDDLDFPNYSITLVRRISAREAMLRLGVQDTEIAPMTFADLPAFERNGGDLPTRVFAVEVDDWVMLIEQNGMYGTDRLKAMSLGTTAVVCAEDYDSEAFLGWAVDGTPLAVYWDDDRLERGTAADAGAQRAAIVPYLQAIGIGRYQDTRDDGRFLPPQVEIACLIAGLRPEPDDFLGVHLGAVIPG